MKSLYCNLFSFNFYFCLVALVGGSGGSFCGVSLKRVCVVCLLALWWILVWGVCLLWALYLCFFLTCILDSLLCFFLSQRFLSTSAEVWVRGLWRKDHLLFALLPLLLEDKRICRRQKQGKMFISRPFQHCD